MGATSEAAIGWLQPDRNSHVQRSMQDQYCEHPSPPMLCWDTYLMSHSTPLCSQPGSSQFLTLPLIAKTTVEISCKVEIGNIEKPQGNQQEIKQKHMHATEGPGKCMMGAQEPAVPELYPKQRIQHSGSPCLLIFRCQPLPISGLCSILHFKGKVQV